ncbi:MAG: hypothetical protein QM784_03870 [Polyangiaceae bacterium]
MPCSSTTTRRSEIEFGNGHASDEADSALLVPRARSENEVIDGLATEQTRQMHAIVREMWLLTEDGDAKLALYVELAESLHEALRDHAISHDDDSNWVIVLHVASRLPRRRCFASSIGSWWFCVLAANAHCVGEKSRRSFGNILEMQLEPHRTCLVRWLT